MIATDRALALVVSTKLVRIGCDELVDLFDLSLDESRARRRRRLFRDRLDEVPCDLGPALAVRVHAVEEFDDARPLALLDGSERHRVGEHTALPIGPELFCNLVDSENTEPFRGNIQSLTHMVRRRLRAARQIDERRLRFVVVFTKNRDAESSHVPFRRR